MKNYVTLAYSIIAWIITAIIAPHLLLLVVVLTLFVALAEIANKKLEHPIKG